ncbi:MAG: PhzF family phenazine biosynthesis protein [Leptolyngbya sp. IPPAS B-1204]
MTSGALYRLSAFTTDPRGGNPAGVWVGDTLPEPDVMQRIAAEVGFSETAFVAPLAAWIASFVTIAQKQKSPLRPRHDCNWSRTG